MELSIIVSWALNALAGFAASLCVFLIKGFKQDLEAVRSRISNLEVGKSDTLSVKEIQCDMTSIKVALGRIETKLEELYRSKG